MTTSAATTSAKPANAATEAVEVVAAEVRYGARFMGKHGWQILLVFLGILLPLLGFAGLVEEVQQKDTFIFDKPVMLALHQMASPSVDMFFVFMSELGYKWGVIPIDVGLLAFLVWRKRYRDGLFFGLAVVGSLMLNLFAKNQFARARPEFWLSLTPESTFSFPSGHAMGSVTLGVALILLFWPTKARIWVLLVAGLFVFLVGLSRIYLGVHFPSDIIAGWLAGTAWVVAMYQLVARTAPTPPTTAAAGPPGKDLIAEKKP